MPLSDDQKTVEVSSDIVKVLHGIFGPHPGFRAAHAKGLLLKGTFTPTSAAASLSKASHFKDASTPVLARFSSSTGFPALPDTDPNGNPRGFAIRFQLASTPRRVHTDIIAHSTPHFPARNGEDSLAFFSAVKDGTLEEFLSKHPEALPFVQAAKPAPKSFRNEKFFGLNAYKFISGEGKETFVRYRIVPEAGWEALSEEEVKGKEANFLFDAVPTELKEGPIVFKFLGQLADEGDQTDDVTVQWPEDRKLVDLGTIKLESLVDDDAEEQKRIIFDPIPRVDGVEASDDPLIDVRASVYLIGGKERRAAKVTA